MLASLTGLLLTLGGEGPAIVFIPPLDPEVFDWNPDDLSLRFVGEVDSEGPRFGFEENGIQQSLVILRPVVFLRPSYPDGNGYDCQDEAISNLFNAGDGGGILKTVAISPRVYDLSSINFGSTENCTVGVARFIELEDLLQSTSRVDEMLDRLESLEQKVKSLEQSLESCQCASDLDGDGAVGFNDLVQLISNWGPCSARNLSKRFQIQTSLESSETLNAM